VTDFTIASEFDLVIRGGTLVTASGVFQADLGVRAGRIAAWGTGFDGRRVLDADGLLVLPGAVDPHVHLAMPAGATRSSDDWASGTLAAAFGGTTTVLDFIEPEPGDSLAAAKQARLEEASQGACIDFGLHMTLSRADPETLADVPAMVGAGCPSFKAYTTYEGFRLDDAEMLRVMQAVSDAGGLLMVHCENDAIIQSAREELIHAGQSGPSAHPRSRPALAESDAVEHVIRLADAAACPLYVVHISTREGALAVRAAKQRGQPVTGETCPQYILLDEGAYASPGFEAAKFVCSPPLRAEEHLAALWKSVTDGTIDTLGTDHCPFNFDGQKDLGATDFRLIPNGLPGIELRLSLAYTNGVQGGRIGLSDWVRLCSTAPAQVFGLYPRKGSLAPGADADIVLFDPSRKMDITHSNLHERVDYTPYEGMALSGFPRTVLRRGDVIVDQGRFTGASGSGVFLPGSLSTSVDSAP
jgi:dihydropyrimidinase